MKALVFHGKNDLRLEDIPEPQCGAGQVKVKPVWCGICGTDLHEYMGGPNLCPHDKPHPITGEKVPLTFGHEFSAIVTEIGEGVGGFKEGDRVAVEPIIWCGTCPPCKLSAHNCCQSNGFLGLSGWGGGLSSAVVCPATSLYHIPDNVSMEAGALVEPLAVGWHAVKCSPMREGDTVLILGGGPIGLSVIQAAKAKGAGKIIVSEVAERRKEYATEFGADLIIDPIKEDIVARIREMTNNRGVDVVYDAAGVQVGLDTGLQCLRVHGTFLNIAIWEKPCTITPNMITFTERKYQGVATYERGDFKEVLEAISKGLIKPERMITKKIKLDEVVKEGFMALIEDKANQVKILVDPSSTS